MELSHLKIGELAPDLSLKDLNGIRHSLSEVQGRIVVVNFWSAECPWSERVDRELMPQLTTWGDQVVYYPIASNANEPEEILRKAAESRGLTFLLVDQGNVVADLYGAVTTPNFFVIDESGILRYQGGYDDVTFRQRKPTLQYLVLAVQAVLAGESPDPVEVPSYGCTIVREAGE